MSEKCNDYDEIEPKLYYENVARFKQQCNKDFKCFVIDQLRPIDHLAPIDALVKKDKAPKSTTLRLRSSSSKREGTRIFGANATATHHLVKLAPLFTRIRQCNDDHEIFRRAGSKARQRKLIELIESNSDSNTVNWATVQPADATSLLKSYIAELRTPLASVDWERTLQLIAECDTVDACAKVTLLQVMFVCLSETNGAVFSQLMSLLHDTAQKSSDSSSSTTLGLILWPNIQRNVSMEIERDRSVTSRLRRDCAIGVIKLMIEQWPQISAPHCGLARLIDTRLISSRTNQAPFMSILPKALRRRLDQKRGGGVRQKLRQGDPSPIIRGADSTGCLTDGTTDDEVLIEQTTTTTKRTSLYDDRPLRHKASDKRRNTMSHYDHYF